MGDYTPVCTTELGRAHQLMDEFTKRGVQVVGLSCDELSNHAGWSSDVLAHMGMEGDKLAFPIIADPTKDIVTNMGMLDPLEKDAAGLPLPARALLVIGPTKTVRLSILYPATTGRNFEEVLRVLDSLQLTENSGLASPVDW